MVEHIIAFHEELLGTIKHPSKGLKFIASNGEIVDLWGLCAKVAKGLCLSPGECEAKASILDQLEGAFHAS